MNLSHRRIPTLLAVSALTLGLAALPVGFGADFAPHLSAAFAGTGNGNGHGNGNGNANGHANDGASDSNTADGNASASDLGALNAAHASPQALAHANPNSRVGRIAAYKNAALAAKAADQAVTDAQAA